MKKALSILLSAIMVFSLIPITAFAAPADVDEIEYVRYDSSFYFEQDGDFDIDDNQEQYFRYNVIGRRTGDKLVVTDSQGAKTEYVAEYNEQIKEFEYVSEGGDIIDEDDITFSENQREVHFTVGSDNYYTAHYKGKSCQIQITVVDNPVSEISYTPVSDVIVYENTNGRWDYDENSGQQYFNYDSPDFRAGDMLNVSYTEGETICYTYYNEGGKYGFYDEYDNKLPENPSRRKDNKPWFKDSDQNFYYVVYSEREFPVQVTVVENPVRGIEYKRAKDDVYLDGDKEYDPYDGAWRYRNPYYQSGDVLTVHTTDGDKVYTCVFDDNDWEYYFEDASGQDRFRAYEVQFYSNQNQTPWTVGENPFYVEYMGFQVELKATVTANPVSSIKYKRAKNQVYVEETNGYFDSTDNVYYYNINYAQEGDVLTVTDSKGGSVSYTCTRDESSWNLVFVSENGAKIDESELSFDSDQRNKAWTLGEENEYTVKYSGRTVTLYAQLITNPVSSIEYERAYAAEIYENSHGWDDNGVWRYNEPDFERGDTLTVYYTDDTNKVFTYDHVDSEQRDLFVAKDGEFLEEVRASSDQYGTPWTLGENEYFVEYAGKKTAAKVTVLKNTTKAIEVVKASPVVLYSGDGYERISYITGQPYTAYNLPFFEEGDKLVVIDEDDSRKEYIYTFNEADGECYFVCGDEVLPPNSMDVYDAQAFNPWTVGGENCYYVQFRGKECTVPVTVVESNVKSISFTAHNPERFVFNEYDENVGEFKNEGGRSFFYYDFVRRDVGDKLTITYKDNSTEVYTVKFDGYEAYLENEKGDRITHREVDIYDRQYDEPWTPDKRNVFYVNYKGVTCEVPVTVKHIWDAGKVTKAATCASDGVKTYTCSACKGQKTEKIAATGKHVSDSGTVTKQATTKATGEKVYKCKVCKKVLKTEKIAMLPDLTLKTVKIKKSAKKVVISATLKQNRKALKGKSITFNFNGKKYKAKTDKKGVAKITVKSSVLKKLKVGKKVTYSATYGKTTVKKKVKVAK